MTGKGDKDRLVPLGRKAIDALRAYLNGRRSDWVFPADVRFVGCTAEGRGIAGQERVWGLNWSQLAELESDFF